MVVTKQEALNHEEHGAIMKHTSVEKDSSIVPSLFFYLFFVWALWPLSISLFFIWALWPLFFISSHGTML